MRRKAKSDLPLPEGPRSRIPSPPRATEVPWTRIMRRVRCAALGPKSMPRRFRANLLENASTASCKRSPPTKGRGEASLHGKPHDKPRADHAAVGTAAILGANGAAMRLDDLLGHGETEPGMGAHLLAPRPLAVEALEDRFELVLGDARARILDRDHHGIAVTPRADVDGRPRRAARERVDDEVAEHLDEPSFDAERRAIALRGADRPGQRQYQPRPPVAGGPLAHRCPRLPQPRDPDQPQGPAGPPA